MQVFRLPAVSLLLLCALGRPALAQRDSPFMAEFKKLMVLKEEDEMAKLVKKNEVAAEATVRDIVYQIREGSDDELEGEIDALGKAWKRAYNNSQFVSLQYDLFAMRLTGPFKKSHEDLIKRYLKKLAEYLAAREKKDTSVVAGIGSEYDTLGDAFSELGDDYLASESYRAYAECFDEFLAGKEADPSRAAEAWGLMLAARDKCELHDSAYDTAKARLAKLQSEGFVKAPGEGPAVEQPPAAPVEAPKPLGATFQIVPDIEALVRPIYGGDSNFQLWASIGLKKVSSNAKFPAMDDSPAVLRTGANKAFVDVDGDGKGDIDIPLTGKVTPIELTIGTGNRARKWAFLAAIGQQQDTYQGFKYNLGPSDDFLNIYIAPAASLVATLDGVRVQVLDDNMDGLYGSAPKSWGYPGLVEGVFQNDLDSVVVGDAKSARPWSRLQKIGAAWYTLEPNESGTDLIAKKAETESGTLQLDAKDIPMTWLVVRGSGQNNDLFFEVVNGGTNKVEVPVGTYELYSGQFTSGKKAQMLKGLALPGSNTHAWKVSKGQTTKVELGAPFKLDFKFKQDDESVTIEGPSIVVTGRGGETYQRLWNCVLAPEVNLRKAGTTKGKKGGRLVPSGSQEDVEAHKGDMQTAWFPIGEPIAKLVPGDKYEVQLTEKKHKVFGNLESDWKGE